MEGARVVQTSPAGPDPVGPFPAPAPSPCRFAWTRALPAPAPGYHPFSLRAGNAINGVEVYDE